jgi:hypothetical protein
VLGAVVAGLVLSSCAQLDPTSNIPTYGLGRERGGPTALFSGTLSIEDGCTWLKPTAGPRHLAVWPEGSFLRTESGRAIVRNRDGLAIAVTGESREYLGGGYTDQAFIESILLTPAPENCATRYWWLVRTPESGLSR